MVCMQDRDEVGLITSILFPLVLVGLCFFVKLWCLWCHVLCCCYFCWNIFGFSCTTCILSNLSLSLSLSLFPFLGRIKKFQKWGRRLAKSSSLEEEFFLLLTVFLIFIVFLIFFLFSKSFGSRLKFSKWWWCNHVKMRAWCG